MMRVSGCGFALILIIVGSQENPHPPTPLSHREKGEKFQVPLPMGEGFRVRAN